MDRPPPPSPSNRGALFDPTIPSNPENSFPSPHPSLSNSSSSNLSSSARAPFSLHFSSSSASASTTGRTASPSLPLAQLLQQHYSQQQQNHTPPPPAPPARVPNVFRVPTSTFNTAHLPSSSNPTSSGPLSISTGTQRPGPATASLTSPSGVLGSGGRIPDGRFPAVAPASQPGLVEDRGIASTPSQEQRPSLLSSETLSGLMALMRSVQHQVNAASPLVGTEVASSGQGGQGEASQEPGAVVMTPSATPTTSSSSVAAAPPQAPNERHPMLNPRRYKTHICRYWEKTGSCAYGDSCFFAHGIGDLRKPDENESMLTVLSQLSEQLKILTETAEAHVAAQLAAAATTSSAATPTTEVSADKDTLPTTTEPSMQPSGPNLATPTGDQGENIPSWMRKAMMNGHSGIGEDTSIASSSSSAVHHPFLPSSSADPFPSSQPFASIPTTRKPMDQTSLPNFPMAQFKTTAQPEASSTTPMALTALLASRAAAAGAAATTSIPTSSASGRSVPGRPQQSPSQPPWPTPGAAFSASPLGLSGSSSASSGLPRPSQTAAQPPPPPPLSYQHSQQQREQLEKAVEELAARVSALESELALVKLCLLQLTAFHAE